jgi:hypothetical protein
MTKAVPQIIDPSHFLAFQVTGKTVEYPGKNPD